MNVLCTDKCQRDEIYWDVFYYFCTVNIQITINILWHWTISSGVSLAMPKSYTFWRFNPLLNYAFPTAETFKSWLSPKRLAISRKQIKFAILASQFCYAHKLLYTSTTNRCALFTFHLGDKQMQVWVTTRLCLYQGLSPAVVCNA